MCSTWRHGLEKKIMNDSKILINRNDRLPRAIISNFNRCVLCFASIFSPISLLYTCVCVCYLCVCDVSDAEVFHFLERHSTEMEKSPSCAWTNFSATIISSANEYHSIFSFSCCFHSIFFFFFVRHRLSIRPTLGRMLYTHFKFIIAFEILFFFRYGKKYISGTAVVDQRQKQRRKFPLKIIMYYLSHSFPFFSPMPNQA